MCSGMPTESLAMGGTSAGICVYLASMAETSLPTLAGTPVLQWRKHSKMPLKVELYVPFIPTKAYKFIVPRRISKGKRQQRTSQSLH